MKLILAVINKEDARQVNNKLVKEGFSVTRLSTSGGFLLAGNVTLMVGIEEEKVDQCIEIIESRSKKRTELVPSTVNYGVGATTPYPLEVTVGGATIFVVDVERFEKV